MKSYLEISATSKIFHLIQLNIYWAPQIISKHAHGTVWENAGLDFSLPGTVARNKVWKSNYSVVQGFLGHSKENHGSSSLENKNKKYLYNASLL